MQIVRIDPFASPSESGRRSPRSKSWRKIEAASNSRIVAECASLWRFDTNGKMRKRFHRGRAFTKGEKSKFQKAGA
jgi:hypothetical protein